MLSKTVKYLILLIAILLWLQAYSPLLYKSSGLFPDDYRYGDLYHLSYLPQFKVKATHCVSNLEGNTDKLPVHLFVIGDSFTEAERVSKVDFKTEKYTYVHWEKYDDVQLDTTKKNILILETVERTFKDHFSQNITNLNTVRQAKSEITINPSWKHSLKENVDKAIVFCFPKGTEERLEHTLFNYDFFLWLRELKATLNFKLFGRVENKVVLSADKQNIFYSEEADSTNSHSAFYPLKQVEIDSLIIHLNHAREKYLEAGFDEVYLSIIPNKVSILSPHLGTYNHLIERIQNDPRVQTPIIDTYSIFKKYPQKYYLKSDTHWTCEGRDIWLEKVNKIFITP